MATKTEAHQALLDAITTMAPKADSGLGLLRLAEAYAWISFPNQPHGGSASK